MACLSLVELNKYVFKWDIEQLRNVEKGASKESDVCYAGSEKESSWQMIFYPKGKSKNVPSDYASFELKMIRGLSVRVSGTVYLVQREKNIPSYTIYEQVFNENDTSGTQNFCKISEIYYPITIRCELKMPEDTKILPYIKTAVDFNKVVTDIHSLLLTGKAADVLIISKDNQEYRAHKAVLSARSEVFAAMFENEMKEKLEGRIEIPDMKGSDVEEMLRYIYSGNIRERSSSLWMNLFVAGDKYKINGLKEICSLYLQQNMCVEISTNVLVLADMHGDGRLKEVAMNFIRKNVKDVVETDGWEVLMKEQAHLVSELFLKMADVKFI